MLTSQTLEQLQALKLPAMAAAWTAQQQEAELSALSFDERFALLVDAEWRARENKRLTRALQDATLKVPHACIEAIDDPVRRELDRALVRQLASCRWVAEHPQILIIGATGVGKTFLACALANQACRKGYRTRSWRASRLSHACALARADGTYIRLLGQLAGIDVLVLDDWGLVPLGEVERRDVLELLQDRSGTRSTGAFTMERSGCSGSPKYALADCGALGGDRTAADVQKLPGRYRQRYRDRVTETRSRVSEEIGAKLSELAARVERELVDFRARLAAEYRAERRRSR